jgi:hypothetical protein
MSVSVPPPIPDQVRRLRAGSVVGVRAAPDRLRRVPLREPEGTLVPRTMVRVSGSRRNQ